MLQRLRNTSSSLDKLAILKTADELYKDVFRKTYDQNVTYGLNYSYIRYNTVDQIEDWKGLFTLLDKLSKRELSGNSAREEVSKFSEANGDLIKLICNKDLDCGVSVGLLDKAFGKNFIQKFKVQLAEDFPIEKVKLPVIGEIKYNGVRIVALNYSDGYVELKTCNGNVIPFPALQTLIMGSMPCGVMLDGELTIGTSKDQNHTTISGMVTSAMRGTPIRKTGLVYNVFDCMPLDNFLTQNCDKEYWERRDSLNAMFNNNAEIEYEGTILRQGATTEFKRYEDINIVFDTVVANGYEGLILKRRDHKYKFKRTTDWVKMKAWNTCDLTCIGTTEGEDKYTGMIGGLVCTGVVGSLADSKLVEVVVSSCLTDAMRAADPSTYIGKTIEIEYNDVILDKATNKWSLFLPKLVQVRYDK